MESSTALTWPIRRKYINYYQDFYDEILFHTGTSLSYATSDVMAWLAFLKKWYATSTSPAGGSSVCALRVIYAKRYWRLANMEYFRRRNNSNRPKRHRRAQGSRVSHRKRRLQDKTTWIINIFPPIWR
jgi:hypothetical protein